jgi:hypothetical protein
MSQLLSHWGGSFFWEERDHDPVCLQLAVRRLHYQSMEQDHISRSLTV